jgi:hypothetical protein
MRKYRYRLRPTAYIAALALLAACAKSAEKKAQQPFAAKSGLSAGRAAAVLDQTNDFPETEVISAAGILTREKKYPSSITAERCLQLENKRPLVQAACLLAWAPGNESSEILENAIASGCGTSRPLAVAAVLRKTPMRRISVDTLLALVKQLSGDPAWLRARALRIWLATNSITDPRISRWLIIQLAASEASSPASLAEIYRAVSELSGAKRAAFLSRFCRSGIAGGARMRCWRFLSAMADAGSGSKLDSDLAAFLPNTPDRDWLLFERAFPSRAALLQPFRKN